ncbi:type I methionyl aminopeptidase [bacterium]|nr:type I methionyl aminopeptidase [bacterium]
MIILKSKREIDRIKESSRVVAKILDLIGKEIRPGITTKMLEDISKEVFKAEQAESAFYNYSVPGNPTRFPGLICVSVNEEVVHGIPDSREIKEGDIVSVDVGVIKRGFYGDGARTFKVGNVSHEVDELLNATQKALEAGISQAESGNMLEDIGRSVQEVVEGAGFSVVRDLVGHGVGRNLHEEPQVPNFAGSGINCRLREGMVLAIEPMVNMGTYKVKTASNNWTVITADRKPSAHFEHTVAITNNGPEKLTVID